jgi:lipoprotein-anchoring transpeptidase ErfK/SrfK
MVLAQAAKAADEGDAMTAMKAMAAAVAMIATAMGAAGQTTQSTTATAMPAKGRVIVVSLEDRKLALVEDGQVKKIYTVAVGKPSTPSPEGTFTIERRVANPVYRHEGKTVQPGPHNPVGSRWMGLSKSGYGIHGTNVPSSIGKAASHGCIRMGKADVEELFGMVEVGDTVELVGKRNQETAQLFGAGDQPGQTQTQTQVAQVQPQATPAAPVKTDAALANGAEGAR